MKAVLPTSKRKVPANRDSLAAIAAAALDLVKELSEDRVTQRIVDSARGIVRARYAALGIFDHKGQIQRFYTSGISQQQREHIGKLPQGRGLLGLVLKGEKPLRVANIRRHPSSVGFPPGHPPMRTFLGMPIRHGSTSFGNLYVADKEDGEPFNREDEMVITLFATRAGIALENARLYEQATAEWHALRAILDSIAAAIFTTDTARLITRHNRQAVLFRGDGASPLEGRLACEVFPYIDEAGKPLCPQRCPTKEALQTGKPVFVWDARIKIDQKIVPISVTAAPIRDGTGAVIGVVETFRDISDLKAAEELRDSIISLVSHELRTPLFHIKGFASSLLQPDVTWDEGTRTDFIRTIDQEADRLTRLVSDLLDMSRLETGRVAMDLQAHDVASLVRGGIKRAQPFLKNHRVLTRLSQKLPPVRADAFYVERVLENLLENASKYSPKGTQITVSAQTRGGMAFMAIKDRGEGIPEAEHQRIFERFVRLGSPAQRPPGTGLGLSICKAIVSAHGGKIWVASRPGQGATFLFTLPLATAKGQA
ncbi:MAG: GAF domain-containing protein [Chloroflexi bacterium]|nr:GAF domain-containing protein [Chloroflexota bacterium]